MKVPVVLVALLLFADHAFSGLPTPRHSRLPAHNVKFLSRSGEHGMYSDIWGYTSPEGRELAIAGTYDGLVFLDVTNPRRTVEVKFIPLPGSGWRDIKTHGTHAYAVNESGGGLAIIDLSDPGRPSFAASYTSFSSAHNLYIDEEQGMAFVAGSAEVPGVIILSLADPVRPAPITSWPSPYAHDVYARDGRMFVSAIYEEALYIVDISSLPAMESLGVIRNYPHAFTHNAWLTADGTHVITTDEEFGASVRVWDVTDPGVQVLADYWWPAGASRAIPHNAIVDGDLAYVSFYTAGVRVVDVSDPTNVREVAWYDTLPWTNGNFLDGCWGVFPFYPKSPGKFVVSDMRGGIYVLVLEPDLLDGGGVEGRRPLPSEPTLRIDRAHPNPARAGEAVVFDLSRPGDGPVSARIHDARGRLVRILDLPAGRGALTWDGRTRTGRRVASGVYFLRVEAEGGTASRSLTIIR